MAISPSLVFKVKRSEPQLLAPAEPTPYEFKNLSDMDNQHGIRFLVPNMQIYRHGVGMEGRDPVNVIREAVAKALVYYYPFAGRLRERPNNKHVVECTGEGVMFIEADASVSLEQFGDVRPPFPCLDDLLYDGPGSGCVFDSPLMLIQVTRLTCGGFIFATNHSHTISDAAGLVQFLTAVGEIARGAVVPSVLPVWKREPIMYQEMQESIATPLRNKALIHRSFFFGAKEISVLRNHLLYQGQKSTRFEILTACVWRCRTIALAPNANKNVGVVCTAIVKDKFDPPLPVGYYGNAVGSIVAVTTAGELCKNPFGYAVELVKKAKQGISRDLKGLEKFKAMWYTVSDLSRIGFHEVDFGWGKAVFGGPPGVGTEEGSFFVSSWNRKGEEGVVVTLAMLPPAMDSFATEIEKLTRDVGDRNPPSILCSL